MMKAECTQFANIIAEMHLQDYCLKRGVLKIFRKKFLPRVWSLRMICEKVLCYIKGSTLITVTSNKNL